MTAVYLCTCKIIAQALVCSTVCMSRLVCLHDHFVSLIFHSALGSSDSGASKITISTSSGSEEEVLDAEFYESGAVSVGVVSVVMVSVVVV